MLFTPLRGLKEEAFHSAEQVCACVEERSAGCVHLQCEGKQTSPGRRTRLPLNVKRREGRRLEFKGGEEGGVEGAEAVVEETWKAASLFNIFHCFTWYLKGCRIHITQKCQTHMATVGLRHFNPDTGINKGLRGPYTHCRTTFNEVRY